MGSARFASARMSPPPQLPIPPVISMAGVGAPPPGTSVRQSRQHEASPPHFSASYIRPSSEVHEILVAAAGSMRVSPEDVYAITEALESNWFDSAQALLRLTEPAASELGVSSELFWAIHGELLRRGAGPGPPALAAVNAAAMAMAKRVAAGWESDTTPGHHPQLGYLEGTYMDTASTTTSPPATPSWPLDG